MPTKKSSKSARTANPKRQSRPSILIHCCSGALDIVMQDDPGFTAVVDENPTMTIRGKKVIKVIRLESEFTKFGIPGLHPEDPGAIDKSTTPWRIFVVPQKAGQQASQLKKTPKKVAKRVAGKK